MEAAMFSEADSMAGVSGNIMMGQLCPFGTGAFDLLLDDVLVQKALPVQAEGLGGMTTLGGALGAAGPTPLMVTPAGFSPMDMGASPGGSGGLQFSPPASAWTPDNRDGSATPAFSGPALGGASPTALYEYMAAYSPAPGALGAGMSPHYGDAAVGRSPAFTPTDQYGFSNTSPAYSPSSPAYSPDGGAGGGGGIGKASPASPAYCEFWVGLRVRAFAGGMQVSQLSPVSIPTSLLAAPTSPACAFAWELLVYFVVACCRHSSLTLPAPPLPSRLAHERRCLARLARLLAQRRRWWRRAVSCLLCERGGAVRSCNSAAGSMPVSHTPCHPTPFQRPRRQRTRQLHQGLQALGVAARQLTVSAVEFRLMQPQHPHDAPHHPLSPQSVPTQPRRVLRIPRMALVALLLDPSLPCIRRPALPSRRRAQTAPRGVQEALPPSRRPQVWGGVRRGVQQRHTAPPTAHTRRPQRQWQRQGRRRGLLAPSARRLLLGRPSARRLWGGVSLGLLREGLQLQEPPTRPRRPPTAPSEDPPPEGRGGRQRAPVCKSHGKSWVERSHERS